MSILSGTWVAKVVRPSGTVEIGMHFGADGSAFIVSGGHGAGSWSSRKSGFVFRIREPVIDEDGSYAGHVDIRQTGSVVGDSFTSEGTSSVFDSDGTLERRVAVSISATRR